MYIYGEIFKNPSLQDLQCNNKKNSVSIKEYANRIFIWGKDECRTGIFYFKKWLKFLYVNSITILKELFIFLK